MMVYIFHRFNVTPSSMFVFQAASPSLNAPDGTRAVRLTRSTTSNVMALTVKATVAATRTTASVMNPTAGCAVWGGGLGRGGTGRKFRPPPLGIAMPYHSITGDERTKPSVRIHRNGKKVTVLWRAGTKAQMNLSRKKACCGGTVKLLKRFCWTVRQELGLSGTWVE